MCFFFFYSLSVLTCFSLDYKCLCINIVQVGIKGGMKMAETTDKPRDKVSRLRFLK